MKNFQTCAAELRRLSGGLAALADAAGALGVPRPDGAEWYELLRHKLLPQADTEPVLVVAVVGGTNIGKSCVFNHLSGEAASAVSPLAAGTRHPVCLAPPHRAREDELARLFEGFTLRRWTSEQDPLSTADEHLLFWREGRHVPPRLLLLDTPDIDSDVPVNWQRADVIRQAADVLVAVLTQQKYNDAAVKQFFRKAAEADKPAIVVFNQCDLVEDRPYWPKWLSTFVDETGAEPPEFVYVVPHDRQAATQLRLPFYSVGRDGTEPPHQRGSSLRDDLASLHFDAIKLRTLRGALGRVVDRAAGAPAWLARVRAASREFAEAAAALGRADQARINWPTLPAHLLVDEIRGWWDDQRSGWSRQIHGAYRQVGRGLAAVGQRAWQWLRGPADDPLEGFASREREVVVRAVQIKLDELERLAQVGNDTLRPRLRALLAGARRHELIDQLSAAHAALPPLDDDYRQFVRAELEAWSRRHPQAVGWLRSLDHVLAMARPAVTLSLVLTGFALPATAVLGTTAAHVVGHVAAETATAVLVTGGGEAAVSMAGEAAAQTAARLWQRFEDEYTRRRAQWLDAWLDEHLLAGLLGELKAGATLPESAAYREAEAALGELAALAAPAAAIRAAS